jgi:hypothetical protein
MFCKHFFEKMQILGKKAPGGGTDDRSAHPPTVNLATSLILERVKRREQSMQKYKRTPSNESSASDGLVSPHGGRLNPLIAEAQEITEERARGKQLTAPYLGTKEVSDLIMLAIGAFSPLNGFMTRPDYLGTVEQIQL